MSETQATMQHPQDAQDHWIETAKGRLFARSWGPDVSPDTANEAGARRAPIVLLHDSLGCVALWGAFPQTLARATNRRVIAYDRAGFGASDARTDRLGEAFVRDEAQHDFPALCEQLGIDRFVVFGHSVGGGMAIECAAQHPPRCVALVTEAAQTFAEDRTLAGIRVAREQFRDPAQFARLARYHGEKTQWVLDAWIETWLSPEFADWSLDAVLPRVQCATLAIHGSLDEYGTRVHPETIAARVSGPARAAIMDGVRHVPHREQEAQVAAMVAEFLREVDG
ncbi:alpha/beta fold hydrolase [Paraburkholderia tagetis]|uniref:Alpha/beta hydrolase n=1 Tax=Paraburkholderia tagetis TaxID=2913261 RepID=A0A9X1RMS9_9BURK|nr:alpha/beta hydrolase [Paraburkholderia tagetis]MCG5075181.1 alpha/beta hydrolase [Paraburkholderia tagetis]